jgi:hypothetical protein
MAEEKKSETTPGEAIPQFETKAPLTEEEVAATPEFQEAQAAGEAEKKEQLKKVDQEAVERLLDRPVEFTIGGQKFEYTSRPLGYLNMIKDQILGLQNFFKQIKEMLEADTEKKGDAPPAKDVPLVTEQDIEEIFISRGEEGLDAMVRIAQLLVEPIHDPPRAPDMNNMKLEFEHAKWGLSARSFAQMISIFFLRDLGTTGVQISNLIRLGQMAP